MGITKTDRDIERERKAAAMNVYLAGTGSGIEVVAGGRRGPYSVIVRRLSQSDVFRLVAVVREAFPEREYPDAD